MLSRWSKLKTAAQKPAPSRGPTVQPPAALDIEAPGPPQPLSQSNAPVEPVEPVEQPKVELPNIGDLTAESDFTPFMQSGVDAADRNAALKKLFTDPHYNQMDGLDIYIDDYSKPDPIPAEMLKRLMASKFLGLYEEPQPDESEAQVQGETLKVAENLEPDVTLGIAETTREYPSLTPIEASATPDALGKRDFFDK
jgi:hypothetical protein